MRRTARTLAITATLTIAIPTVANARNCPLPPVDGAGWTKLTVTRATCADGRTIARQMERGRISTEGNTSTRFAVLARKRAWLCLSRTLAWEQGQTTCRSGNRTVRLWSGA